ncbi:hypothetical protein REPUB_Repub18cG0161700 [Reevesia pubescens]
MESCYRYSVSAFTWLSVFAIFMVFFMISTNNFNSFVSFSASSPESLEPKLELQRLMVSTTRPDQIRAVDNHHQQQPNRLRNITVTRKTKKLSQEQVLKQGLARARASIRSSAIAGNVTVATFKNDNDVPVGDVYRNPTAFYR